MEQEKRKTGKSKDSIELEALELRFENLFENNNDAVFWYSLDTEEIIYVNTKATELLEYSKEEIYKLGNQGIIAPDEIDKVENNKKIMKKGDMPPLYERVFLSKTGERIICELNVSHFFDTITKMNIVQTIARDITHKKRSEEMMSRDRQIFHNIALSAVKSNNSKEFCEEILENLLENLKFDFGSIGIFDKNSKEFKLIASINVPDDVLNDIKSSNFSGDKYLLTQVLSAKKTLLISDFHKTPDFQKFSKFLKLHNINSMVVIPILDNKTEILGLMQLSSLITRKFSKNDVILYDSIAVMVAAVLEKYFVESALAIAHDYQLEMDRIINHSPAIAFLWKNSEGWPVEYVSDNISLLGYTPEDFYSGRVPYDSIIVEEDLETVANEVAKYSRETERKTFSQEYRVKTKSGEIHWISDYTTIRRNSKGEITHFHGIILDNTEKKLAEDSLKNKRVALEIISNASAVSSTIPELSQIILKELTNFLDYDIGIINFYDPETKNLVPSGEYKAYEVLGNPLPIVSIDHPEYLICYAAKTKKAIFAPDISKLTIDEIALKTVKNLKLKSTIIWPILKSNNDLLAILQLASFKVMSIGENQKHVFEALAGTLSNNFERILVEDEKRASDEKFRAFAEQSISGVLLFGKDGDIFFVNNRMSEITEYTKEEISNMKIGKFLGKIHPHLVSENSDMLDVTPLIDDDLAITNEYKVFTKNGIEKWVMVNLTPFKISEDIYYAVLMVDITKEKQAEEQLQELNRELENRVDDRTAQLEILYKELEAFTYSVSHDLRTPLRSIDGFSQALAVDYSDAIDSVGQDYLSRIRKSAKRMGDLIDDMLNLSKLSRMDMTIHDVNLTILADGIVKELKEQYPKRKVKIKIGKNLETKGDPVLLRQLLENLLSNAWKFTGKTSQAVIDFGSKETENETVFYIKDNGTGFDMAYMDKLFEIFQRLHTQEEFKGTGVGLAIVKRIIERHKGKVWAEGEVNKGATFFFSLPKNTPEKSEK